MDEPNKRANFLVVVIFYFFLPVVLVDIDRKTKYHTKKNDCFLLFVGDLRRARKKKIMAFDADPLWWPPAARLHATLVSAAAEAAATGAASSSSSAKASTSSTTNDDQDDDNSIASSSAKRLSATLKEYERWLVAGLHTFRGISHGPKATTEASGTDGVTPQSASRAALLAGAPLSLAGGTKKIAVDGRLVQAALELSAVAVSWN